ncbi:MAG TPA: hypothetical protein VF050_05225, partial [Moraxellaceae bacterium]
MPKSSSTLCCLLLALCFIQAASASTTPCRSKGTNEEVLAYQGSCVEGYLQGRTEAVIRYVDRVGTPQVRKQFGWYENGVPTGMHTMLVSSLFLFVYDNNGASQAAFQLPMPGSALWQNVLPAAVEYTRFGDPSLYWAELEKKDGNFFYPAESPRGKERGNIGRLKDILRYGDIYARSTKQATSVGNHALLLYLDSLPVSEPFKSKEQLSVNKLLFPDNSAALIQRLKPQDNEALV